MKIETLAEENAHAVHLRYVHDGMPGITRIKKGKAFVYKNESGKIIKDKKIIERINSLAIPPAYVKVWICPFENGHLQATGIDARGRKQYRYHVKWREVRDENKYARMADFGKALPKIHRQVKKDIKLSGLTKEKVLAAIVELLEKTLIRVGNEEYVKENQSFGLTTLHNKHVQITGSHVHFEFKGKSGVYHEVDFNDPKLAKIIKSCRDLPGHELFEYIDVGGDRHSIRSEDVNEYLQSITGKDFTAKDFRTWYGTVLAAQALNEFKEFDSEAEAKRNVSEAIEKVSIRLGNTKAICRKCYIHPAVLECYLDKTLPQNLSVENASLLMVFLKKR